MKATIEDRDALLAVSPAALSAYARSEGWAKAEPYGDYSDVYAADGLPEIILPRTEHLGDYANVVSTVLGIFARTAGVDELALYRDLVNADRDVIRMRASESDDGTVAMDEGVDFVRGASDVILAAACSFYNPQPLFRAGANREARAYLRQMRLGQTEQGSFVVTLLSPVVPPPMQLTFDLSPEELPDDAVERRITRHLASSLSAARQAIEGTVGGEADAFAGSCGERCKRQPVRGPRHDDHALLDDGRQLCLGAHAACGKGAGGHPFFQRRCAYIAGGGARFSTAGSTP